MVLSGDLSASAPADLQVFDFAAWGYADWNAASSLGAPRLRITVDPDPEMYRRDSTSYEPLAARDTRLNRVNVTGVLDLSGSAPRLRVRAKTAPGRDLLEVNQRWVSAARVVALERLWSRENGVVELGSGQHVNRIPAKLLDVHPAMVWHTARTGEAVDVGRTPECYDCYTNPYTDSGEGLYRRFIAEWTAAGRPVPTP